MGLSTMTTYHNHIPTDHVKMPKQIPPVHCASPPFLVRVPPEMDTQAFGSILSPTAHKWPQPYASCCSTAFWIKTSPYP